MVEVTSSGPATVTLPTDEQILIRRAFDAPKELVFKAYTTPELVKRWWGFETSEWLVCDIDLRVGGMWRYVTREQEGYEVAFHGEFKEIDAPQRLVSTEVFEMFPDAAALDTVVFEEEDGVTTMREVRKLEHRKDLPIIAVTAKAMKGDREKCIEAGAWDYLSKPVDTIHLLGVLKSWLHR